MSKFLRELGRKEILTPHVDRWFTRYQPKIDPVMLPIQIVKEEDSYFHPSSHTVGCARTIFKAFDPHFAEENSRRKFNNKVMMNGHLWHALIEHIVVDELGFADSSEDPIWAVRFAKGVMPLNQPPELEQASKYNRWVAKGTLDIPFVRVPGFDEQYVVDIKTMNPDSYMLEYPPTYLWLKYQAQMQLYLDWTNLNTGILFCVQAGNPFNFKEIIIERDNDLIQYIYQKWDMVHQSIQSGHPPDHTCADPSTCSSNESYVDAKPEESVGA